HHLTTADVWQAYKRLEASLVRGAPSDKVLTDIISLVRFATGQADVLEPYAARVDQRFNLWIGRQKKAGRDFNEEQMNWLRAIKDYLAANVEIAPADLMRDHPFTDWGGVVAARKLFGAELNGMLDDLTEALAAGATRAAGICHRRGSGRVLLSSQVSSVEVRRRTLSHPTTTPLMAFRGLRQRTYRTTRTRTYREARGTCRRRVSLRAQPD